MTVRFLDEGFSFLRIIFNKNFLSYLDLDYTQNDSASSSPIFFEKPGIPELDDEDDVVSSDKRRVRFSTAPIRVREKKKIFLRKYEFI
jgi:hypothetical protein